LFNANSAIFQLYIVFCIKAKTTLLSMRWWWSPLCSRPTRWV